VVTLCGALAVASCSDSGTGPPQAGEIHVEGRVERSLTIQLLLVVGGDTLPRSAVEWTVQPSGSATLLPGGLLRLEEVGSLTISGTGSRGVGDITLQVTPPPRIVFSMSVAGNRDIYSVALDGRDLFRQTDSPFSDVEPTAKGGQVVFTSYRHGNGELYRVPVAGGPALRLTNSAAHETQPRYSPDGTRIAYTSDAGGATRVWTATSEASQPSRAAPGLGLGGSVEGSPSWSPQGDRLVFMSTAAGVADLYIVQLQSGAAQPLVSSPDPDVEPAWSPDGTQVAFASARGGQTDLYRVRLSDQTVTRLTDRAGIDGEPAWLPDGRLVYVAWTGFDSELRWLDPEHPGVTHDIPLLGQQPRHPQSLP